MINKKSVSVIIVLALCLVLAFVYTELKSRRINEKKKLIDKKLEEWAGYVDLKYQDLDVSLFGTRYHIDLLGWPHEIVDSESAVHSPDDS